MPEGIQANSNMAAYDELTECGLVELSDTAINLNIIAAEPDSVEFIRRGVTSEEDLADPEYVDPYDLEVPGTARVRYNAWIDEFHPDWEYIPSGLTMKEGFEIMVQEFGGPPEFKFSGFALCHKD